MLHSLLYVPAHSERFLSKAHERGADAIILDLEDAVPEADKDRARAGLNEAASSAGRNGAQIFVRINAGERQPADAEAAAGAPAQRPPPPEAEAAAGAHANAIILAKADRDDLDGFPLPLIAMLESPGAILDARD